MKREKWLYYIRSMVLLCTRAIGAILNYTLIREFRKRFLPQSNYVCPCSHKRVETQAYILNDYSWFIYKNADYMLCPIVRSQEFPTELIREESVFFLLS